MILWAGPLNVLLFKEHEKAADFKGDFHCLAWAIGGIADEDRNLSLTG